MADSNNHCHQDAPIEMEAFRFLDLPGELRNRIYAFAVETSSRIRVVPRAVQHPVAPKATSSALHLPHYEPDEEPEYMALQLPRKEPREGPEANSMALAQVCQQIRSEFLPLLCAEQSVQIHVRHIAAYIRHLETCDVSSIPRTLTICMKTFSTHDREAHERDAVAIDLLSLLLLRKRRNDLVIRMRVINCKCSPYCGCAPMNPQPSNIQFLDDILDAKDVWDAVLDNRVFEKIVFRQMDMGRMFDVWFRPSTEDPHDPTRNLLMHPKGPERKDAASLLRRITAKALEGDPDLGLMLLIY